jgi:hypothetical protein
LVAKTNIGLGFDDSIAVIRCRDDNLPRWPVYSYIKNAQSVSSNPPGPCLRKSIAANCFYFEWIVGAATVPVAADTQRRDIWITIPMIL